MSGTEVPDAAALVASDQDPEVASVARQRRSNGYLIPVSLMLGLDAAIQRPGNYAGAQRDEETEAAWRGRAVRAFLTAGEPHAPSMYGYCHACCEEWPCTSAGGDQ